MNSASYKKTYIYTYCWLAQTFGNQIKYAIRNFWVTEALHPSLQPLAEYCHSVSAAITENRQPAASINHAASAGSCWRPCLNLWWARSQACNSATCSPPQPFQWQWAPRHPLPRTPQAHKTRSTTGSLHPYSPNAQWGILSHQQSHTTNQVPSDGYKLHLTREPHLLLQKGPRPELGSPMTPEVAVLPH